MSQTAFCDGMTQERLRTEMLAFLARHNVMSLATCAPDGMPHAANLMFANEGFVLYWLSDPDSRHSRHIETDPRAAKPHAILGRLALDDGDEAQANKEFEAALVRDPEVAARRFLS